MRALVFHYLVLKNHNVCASLREEKKNIVMKMKDGRTKIDGCDESDDCGDRCTVGGLGWW